MSQPEPCARCGEFVDSKVPLGFTRALCEACRLVQQEAWQSAQQKRFKVSFPILLLCVLAINLARVSGFPYLVVSLSLAVLLVSVVWDYRTLVALDRRFFVNRREIFRLKPVDSWWRRLLVRLQEI